MHDIDEDEAEKHNSWNWVLSLTVWYIHRALVLPVGEDLNLSGPSQPSESFRSVHPSLFPPKVFKQSNCFFQTKNRGEPNVSEQNGSFPKCTSATPSILTSPYPPPPPAPMPLSSTTREPGLHQLRRATQRSGEALHLLQLKVHGLTPPEQFCDVFLCTSMRI